MLLLSLALAQPGYLQHPTVHGQQLVVQAEGDLWLAPLDGGTAQRLTSHVGVESQPALSPDGREVAFLAEYDGARAVYVMPVDGGAPRRLTWEDAPISVEGWTPDGDVLVQCGSLPGPPATVFLRAIDPDDRQATDWPLVGANQGAVGPAGQRVFTRFGPHTRGDNVRAYRGGALASLWVAEPGASEARPLLPDLAGNALDPMWVGDRLYFLADTTGLHNLYSVDAEGRDLRTHTTYTELQARRASTDGTTIVFQRGADVVRFDPDSGSARPIGVEIRSDLDDARERWVSAPLDFPSSVHLAPSGEQVVVTSRGQVTLTGTRHSRRITLALPDGARARGAQLSPDGRWVYAIVDREGQDEIVRLAVDGQGEPEPITRDGAGRRWRFVISPDGRRVVHSDARGHLWLTEVDGGETVSLIRSASGDDPYPDLVFAPDGSALAFTRWGDARTEVFLHDFASGRTERVASDRFPAHSPAFSPDGAWLWFVSERHFEASPRAPWGDRVMGPAFHDRGGVYALSLTNTGRFPFLPPLEGADAPDDRKKEKRRKKAPGIVWEGLQERLYEVPLEPGDHVGLGVTEERLYVLSEVDGEGVLRSIALEPDAEAETLDEDVDAFALSAERETLMLRHEDTVHLVEAGASLPDALEDHEVDLDWRVPVVPADEWLAMFDDAWRMHRDLSFDPAMRGLDWEAVHDRYRPLAERVTHRGELDDVLGEMAAELGILHSQVRGGELPDDPEGGREATLAIETRPVEAGLEITVVYEGDPDLLDERGPLARPEVDVGVGDVIQRVEGRDVRDHADLSEALVDRAGERVLLEVRDPEGRVREVLAEPRPARELRARRVRHWEQVTRARVEAASEGRVGYLHLQAMGGGDIADFAREYFAVVDREGLILDVRGNRGGNIDSWVIGELSRKAWAFWQSPHGDRSVDSTNMQRAFRGHLVVLIDQGTYSDGETFAAGIKALGLAPLVGTRTAGAGIWLSDRNLLADGGRARIGEFAQFDLDGRWIVEGRGVSPDIEVDNLPMATWNGGDAQLERALQILRDRIEAEPIPVLKGEPIPPVGTPAREVRRR